jgi:hypothetical protein
MKCSLWLAILILAVAGCASPEHFETAKVDRNGSFYIDCSPAVLVNSYSDLCDSVVKTAAKDGSLEPQIAESIISSTLLTKILLRYSGANEIKRLRASSSTNKDGSYLNCAALQIEPDEKNGVTLFGENRELSKHIAALPAECISASAVSLDLAKLWSSVKDSKLDLKNKLAALIRTVFAVTPEEFAARHNGVFVIASFPPAADPKYCLTVPDKDKKLYEQLEIFAGKKTEELFDIPFNSGKLYIAHKGERTILCGSAQIRELVLKPEKTLSDVKEFSESPANSAISCVELDWFKKGTPSIMYLGGGKGFSKPAKVTEHNIWSRTKYGFYLTSISSNDLNVDLFRNELLDQFAFFDLIKGFSANQPAKQDNTQSSKQKTDGDPEKCYSNLLKLRSALQEYAEKNGSFPSSLHTDGFNQLTDTKALTPEIFVCPDYGCDIPRPGVELVNDNTGYVYFGNWKKGSSGKLPLVIDLPDSHSDFFLVLLSDGTIEKIELPMQMSVKRMASTLHTVFKYQEDEFSELIRRAEILDKKLDKESK